MKQGEASDREQIVDLLARLAQATDQGSLEEYGACFTEDAAMHLPGAPAPVIGRDNLLASSKTRRASGGVGPGSKTRHVVSTTSVRVAGDTAASTSYVVFYSTEGAAPVAKAVLVYSDSFRRTGAGWQLSERRAAPG